MSWEPDYLGELNRRLRLMRRARTEPYFRACLLVVYKNDPVKFIEDCCFTYDPRKKLKLMPFLLFERQKHFVWFVIACLTSGNAGLVEKCRDMGFTWLCVCLSTWLWLFTPGASVGFGSRKQELVDRMGDPDSIFEKIRMTLRYLPEYLLPVEFVPRQHATFMKIINPGNGATITGEIGDSIGRGGRKQIYFKDESAHYERPELIEAALGDNTDVQIDISSVNGAGNVFYRRRMAGEIWEPGKDMPPGKTWIFVGDWRDDPRKSVQWYEMRRARSESEGLLHIFAQEVDRDYFSSQEKIVIRPEWVKAAIDAHKILNFKAQGEKTGAQDVADGGGDRNAFVSRHGVVMTSAEHWAGEAQEAAKRSIPEAVRLGINELYYDCIGVGAGFKAQANTMRDAKAFPATLRIIPWDAAGKVSNPEGRLLPGDSSSPKNEDHFLNFKAQGWWGLRTRFYKVYRAVHHKEKYNPDELISIPSDLANMHQLVMELSQPVYDYNQAGKMLIDKTPEGTSSPNMGDACMMCYFPAREPRGYFSV